MSLKETRLPAEETQRARNAYQVAAVIALAFLLMAVMYAYLALRSYDWRLFVLTGIMTVATLASVAGLRLSQKNRIDPGIGLMLVTVMIVLPVSSLLIRGLGVYLGIAQLAGFSFVIALTISQRHRYWLVAANIASAVLIVLLDIFGSGERYALPFTRVFVPAVVGLGLVVIAVLFARDFRNYGLRTKIALGILVTGGLTVSVIVFFAVNRSGQLINTLTGRVETTVNLLAQEQLINTVSSEANRANRLFDTAIAQVTSLADQLEQLQQQKNLLGDGTYWNAGDFLNRGGNGQYYTNSFTPSSIFVPSNVEVNETVIRELNTTAYLDFSAPFVLENNPQITAIYYTNPNGILTYYPNIGLGKNLPHDYDPTAQPPYRVATPLFNSQKEPRWSFPRQDPAGTGLVISISAPVYFQNEFRGVMTADFKLDRIADEINAIKVGSTGYAFLIDNDGHIIAMPEAGYEFLDLQPEELGINQPPKLTVFDGGTFETQSITRRMVVGGSGIVTTDVNNVDTYIAYAPVAGNAFSLAVVVPVEELNRPYIETRNAVETQTQDAVRTAVFILLALLAGAVVVSIVLGQIISAPVLRLTQTTNQIVEGDLTAQAKITSRDEVGTLAQAFNTMTSRLRETLEGLEKNVAERTAELKTANERNERRAAQFQSIAQVARTISSTLDLDSLLTQITSAINRELGFYHVGIFLLDAAGEYAVLGAANSEGGQRMLARGHRLKVGEKGLVGFVAGTNRPRVALDTGADAVFFNNPDLPDTRSEIALPLRAGEVVIGVLDVQSTEPNAFSQEDVSILSTLADQVSIAIQNARQNEATQKALAESRALSQQFVQTGWQAFVKKQKLAGVHHTGAKATLLYSNNGSGKKGVEVSEPDQTKSRGRGATLSLPIRMRDQVIGSVEVRAPDNRQWDQDELDIVTAIIERAAIAMENARLLAESQKRAAKERTIGDISARITAQTDMDELLRTAALELGRTIPGAEIAIQFKKDETE